MVLTPEVPVRILRTVFLAAVLLLASPVFFFAQGDNGKKTIIAKDEKFSCSIQKASFVNAMDTLFSKGGREYALLSKPNISLENMTYSDKEFDTLLTIILSQCSCDYTVSGDVYYIYEIQKKDVVKQLKETKVINLEYISLDSLTSMLPGELNASSFMKQDRSVRLK